MYRNTLKESLRGKGLSDRERMLLGRDLEVGRNSSTSLCKRHPPFLTQEICAVEKIIFSPQ